MESIADYGYSGINNDTKDQNFLHDIKSTELEAAVNVAGAQQEKYGTDFDVSVSYLGQMVTKKGPSMQSVNFVKPESQLMRLKVVVFMGKVECKK